MLKAASWRMFGTVATGLLVFLFTGRLDLAVAISGLDVIAKMLLYFVHERIWDRIRIGRKELQPFVLWFTGLPATGKSTLADRVADHLRKKGLKVERLDGDQVRHIFPSTGFRKEDRDAHIKRIGYLSSMLEKNGVIVIASFVSPYREAREFVRRLCKNFHEIYVDTPLEICELRDTKGLYKKARAGLVLNFTGINDPYEPPSNPELVVSTENQSAEESSREVIRYVERLIDR